MSQRNTFSDGEPFSVAALNSLKHAFQGEGVDSGGALTPGTGDWDVDIAAVDYTVGDSGGFSLTSDTVTVSNPSTEDRLDLITATTTPGFNVVEGAVASTANEPNAPDIPTDEVLLGAVYVDSEASSIASGDLYDSYQTPVQHVENWTTDGEIGTVPVSDGNNGIAMEQSPGVEFGDGSDGEIIHSTNANESGMFLSTRYVVEDGVTISATDGELIVYATEEIVIDGTIDVTAPHGGGDGATSEFTGGGDGDDATLSTGSGGAGGDVGGTNGGGGGSPITTLESKSLRTYSISPLYDSLFDTLTAAGAGGGGGAAGSAGNSQDGQGNGGDGGNGGGSVMLVAPSISISGSISVTGGDGQDGGDGDDPNDNAADGGGGGGGGSGGVVIIHSHDPPDATTIDTAGGLGGAGGDGQAGAPAGDGNPGEDGEDGDAVLITLGE